MDDEIVFLAATNEEEFAGVCSFRKLCFLSIADAPYFLIGT